LAEPSSFGGIVGETAARSPDTVGLTFLLDGEKEVASLTYAQFHRRATAIAATLVERGLRGQRVLLAYPPGLDFVAAFFGCLYAGATAVPIYPPEPFRLERTMPRFRAIAADADAKALCTVTEFLGFGAFLKEQAPELAHLEWIATETIPDANADQFDGVSPSPSDVALLQYTSGSTADAKGVVLTHANLHANLAHIRGSSGAERVENSVFWIPPYHDMGLMGGILFMVRYAVPVTLFSPIDFLKKPLRWLHALSGKKACATAAPNFAFDLVARKVSEAEKVGIDLSGVCSVINGAEPVQRETLERFSRAFASTGFRPEAFQASYGMAEVVVHVSSSAFLRPPLSRTFKASSIERSIAEEVPLGTRGGRSLVSCGTPLPPTRVVIVDPEARTLLPEGRIGEIWYQGESAAQGYWNRPELSSETFAAHLAEGTGNGVSEGPYLRTGDLGFLVDGELYITGRKKDLLIFRGLNHYPPDIELSVVKAHPGFRPGCGAAFSLHLQGEERLVIVQEVERKYLEGFVSEPMTEAVVRAVGEAHGLDVYGIVFLAPNTIPKTSSGKVQRRACKQAFLSGSLETVGEWVQDVAREVEGVPAADSVDAEGVASTRTEVSVRALGEPNARAVRSWFVSEIASLKGMNLEAVDSRKPFESFGLNSADVVGMAGKLEPWIGQKLAPTLFYNCPNIDALSEHLATLFETRKKGDE